jgi:hypothetical protein
MMVPNGYHQFLCHALPKDSPHLHHPHPSYEWSPAGKARGSQETPIRGEHPVPEDHGFYPWSSGTG